MKKNQQGIPPLHRKYYLYNGLTFLSSIADVASPLSDRSWKDAGISNFSALFFSVN